MNSPFRPAPGAGSYDQRSPRYLAAVGLLLLRGATAAGRNGDRETTHDFLTEAKEVARYVAFDRPDAWANFSPTNVALHEISAAVSFGDAGTALQTARPLMRRHIPVPERRAALWVEAAWAPTVSRADSPTATRPCASPRAARHRTSDARPYANWSPTWQPVTVAGHCPSSTTSAANWECPRE